MIFSRQLLSSIPVCVQVLKSLWEVFGCVTLIEEKRDHNIWANTSPLTKSSVVCPSFLLSKLFFYKILGNINETMPTGPTFPPTPSTRSTSRMATPSTARPTTPPTPSTSGMCKFLSHFLLTFCFIQQVHHLQPRPPRPLFNASEYSILFAIIPFF